MERPWCIGAWLVGKGLIESFSLPVFCRRLTQPSAHQMARLAEQEDMELQQVCAGAVTVVLRPQWTAQHVTFH